MRTTTRKGVATPGGRAKTAARRVLLRRGLGSLHRPVAVHGDLGRIVSAAMSHVVAVSLGIGAAVHGLPLPR